MSIVTKLGAAAAFVAAIACANAAEAATVSFTQLTGLTGAAGGAATAVFKADLSSAGLSSISAFSITDSGVIGGSAPGQFSGFDLDAVIISNTDCATAACVAALSGDVALDYNNVIFSPGSQTAPVDPKLYGTDASGTAIDNSVATLGAFDGFSSTITPSGFVSLGINGMVAFNLAAPLDVSSPIYLYIGEVGNNGELAEGGIKAFSKPVSNVPLPAALPLFLAGLGALGLGRKRRR